MLKMQGMVTTKETRDQIINNVMKYPSDIEITEENVREIASELSGLVLWLTRQVPANSDDVHDCLLKSLHDVILNEEALKQELEFNKKIEDTLTRGLDICENIIKFEQSKET